MTTKIEMEAAIREYRIARMIRRAAVIDRVVTTTAYGAVGALLVVLVMLVTR